MHTSVDRGSSINQEMLYVVLCVCFLKHTRVITVQTQHLQRFYDRRTEATVGACGYNNNSERDR